MNVTRAHNLDVTREQNLYVTDDECAKTQNLDVTADECDKKKEKMGGQRTKLSNLVSIYRQSIKHKKVI